MKNYDTFVLVDYVVINWEYPQGETNILGVYSSFDKAIEAMKKIDMEAYCAGGNRKIHDDELKYYEDRVIGRDFFEGEDVEHHVRVVAFEMDKGNMSDLITDMIITNSEPEEIAKAVNRSIEIMDAEKGAKK